MAGPQASAPRSPAQALASTYLPALILGLGTGIALPAVPKLAASYGVSFGAASGVITAFMLGNLLGALPSGWLIDRFGQRRVMIAGPLLTAAAAAAAFLVVAAHSFAELLVLRFADGFAAQLWLMARLAGMSHHAAPGQRGRQVSWLFGMDNLGKLAGPLAGGFVAALWGPRATFVAYGALALLTLIPTVLLAEDTPHHRARPRTDRQARLRAVVWPRLPFFGIALFAGLARGPLYADLLHLYAAFTYHLDPRQIGYLATGAAAVALPLSFLAGWMLDRFGRRRTMVPGFVAVAVTMTALAVSAFARLPVQWYVALFLLAVAAQALTGGSIQTIGADVAPPQARGAFLGLWRFVGQGGTALSPILFAVLATSSGYGSAFLFTALTAGVVAVLLQVRVSAAVPEVAG